MPELPTLSELPHLTVLPFGRGGRHLYPHIFRRTGVTAYSVFNCNGNVPLTLMSESLVEFVLSVDLAA